MSKSGNPLRIFRDVGVALLKNPLVMSAVVGVAWSGLGLPLPKPLLQEILSFYSRTSEKPNGLSLDDPFALPAGIREIQVTRGQAVVVQ
mgnify:CR=1 FL=1